MARIEYIAKALGLGIAILFILFPGISQSLQFTVFGLILLLVGIPHGGIDHLIHDPDIRPQGLVSFILRYLLLMLGYGLLWWFVPLAALIAFLGMSAYHFGQSHF
ncbi:MAG: Brp/Blh family beta-carotene 15,15'-dioxygenase, partial [Algoriphagus sp.]